MVRMLTGSYNTFLGYRAGQGTGGAAATSGGSNTAIGYELLKVLGQAVNIAIGHQASLGVSTGTVNVVVGRSSFSSRQKLHMLYYLEMKAVKI